MKKASEYRKVHKGSNTLEQKYARVLEIIHKELEINAERGISSIKVLIPICEDDLDAFGKLFRSNGYHFACGQPRAYSYTREALLRENELIPNGEIIDWYEAKIWY